MKIYRIAEPTKSIDKAIEGYTGDRLKGGLSDNKSPSDFPIQSIKNGIKVELEHTDDVDLALEIVMDHLTEDVNYYTKLKKMESNEDS